MLSPPRKENLANPNPQMPEALPELRVIRMRQKGAKSSINSSKRPWKVQLVIRIQNL
jgi:hypothetical protein